MIFQSAPHENHRRLKWITVIILSQHNVLLGNFDLLGFMWTPLDTYHRVRSTEAWPWIGFCSEPSSHNHRTSGGVLWRLAPQSDYSIGLGRLELLVTIPEPFLSGFSQRDRAHCCWRGAAVAISRFLSRSFHYNEMITVIHFTRQRFLTLSCDKPAKSASSSSLLLGTMLLVDGTKVQQGQWTPSFRPRLFSDRWKRRQRKTSADDDEVQNHC